MNNILRDRDLKKIEKFARINYIPVLLEDTAKLLGKVVKLYEPKNILEIGTAIGYSGTIMLKSSKESQLTTIELDEKNYKMAEENFKNFNLSDRVTQLSGDAYVIMEELATAFQKYDFIFLDGPKGQYIKYLPIIKRLLNDGGILFADNVLYKGMVKSQEFIPHKKRTIVVNLRRFLDAIQSDIDFACELRETGDGVMIAKKVSSSFTD